VNIRLLYPGIAQADGEGNSHHASLRWNFPRPSDRQADYRKPHPQTDTLEASILRLLQAQFPTIADIAITNSGGVQAYVVIAMTPRYEGEARHAILAAMASNLHPKWVVVVDLDVDIRKSSEVEWAMSFRVKPGETSSLSTGRPQRHWTRTRTVDIRVRSASTPPDHSGWNFRKYQKCRIGALLNCLKSTKLNNRPGEQPEVLGSRATEFLLPLSDRW
jgi:hypothetical protein